MRSITVGLFLCVAVLMPRSGATQSAIDASQLADSARGLGVMIDPKTPYGSQLGARFVGAPAFAATSLAGAQLAPAGQGFFGPTALGATFYAPLDLEPGVIVTSAVCLVNDTDAAQNISISMTRSDITIDPDTKVTATLATASTAGTPGITTILLDPTDFTFTTLQDGTAHVYLISVGMPGGSPTFAGCWVYYRRQVAPGPAVATFADVPTTSPYFRYVEALYAAGVISGCAGGNFCPGTAVTRGQLAVILSVALGLGYVM
jgi:hypothetical protein